MAENDSDNSGLREKLMAEYDKAKKTGDNSRLSDIQKQMRQMPGLKIPQEYLQDGSSEDSEGSPEFGQPGVDEPEQTKEPSATRNYEEMVERDKANSPRPIDKNPTPGEEANAETAAPSLYGRAKSAIGRIPGVGKKNAQEGEEDSGSKGGKPGKGAKDKAETAKEDIKTATNIASHGAQALAGNLVAAGQLIRDLWKNRKTRKIIYVLFMIPLLIVLTETAVFATFIGFLSGSKINSLTGGTMTVAANPLTDREWIEKVLGLSGDTNIGSKMSTSLLTGLSGDISNLKTQATDPNVKAKLDAITIDISKVQSSKTNADANKLVDDLKDLMSNYENGLIPAFTGPTSPPLGAVTPTGYTTTPHGGSYINKTHIEGHGVYIQYDKGTCDAVDVDAPAATAVDAIFGGTVVKSESDMHGASIVYIQSSGGEYIADYAHMNDVVPKGKVVVAGDKIGTISKNHVHIEIEYKGSCLVTTHADKIDWVNNGSGTSPGIGQYLYNTIKSKFHF